MSGLVKFTNKIGLGTMGLTWDANLTPKPQAFEVIKTAIDNGVDLIVSGEFYGNDPKELNLIYLKEFFEQYPELRSKVKISVKGGIDTATLSPTGDELGVSKSINNILKYLDLIDIFECARVDSRVPIEDTVGYIKKFIDLGKVGGISLSEVSAKTIRRAAAVHPISAIEIEFSIWCPEILSNGVYEAAQELGIPILAYSPLGRGFLVGQLKSFEDSKKVSDVRGHLDRFTKEDIFNHNLAIVHKIEEVAAKKGITTSQLALAWILKHKGIVPIFGTRTPKRVTENLKSAEIELTEAEFKEINDFILNFEIKGSRYNAGLEHLLYV